MSDIQTIRKLFLTGCVIPAHPLALNANRKLDERRQTALTRYYCDAGAGGVAVGVHTTQFAIHDPKTGLLEPVLRLAADAVRVNEQKTGRKVLKVAGICCSTDQAAREAVLARLGLIPAWAKDPAMGSRMINARAETVSVKPAFRDAFRLRRCIVPTNGFYRWRSRGGPKQLYLIQRQDGAPMGLAGLWELWKDPKTGEEITSCAIITCEPNSLIAKLHDRMPVILDPADYNAWLDPARGGQELLRPCPEQWLEATPVNGTGTNDTTLLQPKGEGPETQGRLL